MIDLVDALCHLEDPRLLHRRQALADAFAAGVRDLVSAGVHPALDPPALALDEEDDDNAKGVAPARTAPLPRVWRAYGVHPAHAPLHERDLGEALVLLERRLDEPDVVALGECGLDKRPGMPPVASQERALVAQLALARRRSLPVIVHCVRATGRLVDVIAQGGPLAAGGVVHGYSGAPDMIPRLVALNLSISFGHIIENPRATRARGSARATPDERLLVESDAPESPPSALSSHIHALAALRGARAEDIGEQTALNARRLFGLPAEGARLAGRTGGARA